MSLLVKVTAFIVLLGALVFFHELGHFLAAKFFRVKVLRFSLGFGPRVWGFKRGETEYLLAALPLGGYVRMAGEDPSQPLAPEDKGRGFSDQKPYRRALIAFAGPAVNLLMPPLVFALVLLAPQKQLPPVVGLVLPGEPAEAAGVRAGDRIVDVGGVPTRSFDEVKAAIEARGGQPVDLVVERDGQQLTLHLTPTMEAEKNPIETLHQGRIGIVAGKLPPYVAVKPGSRAALAGVETFDRITKLNGRPIATDYELQRALRHLAPGPTTVELVRTPVVKLATAPVATAKTMTIQVPAGPGELGFDDPQMYVREVLTGSAAWSAGLLPNDKIVQVNGKPVENEIRYQTLVDGKKALDLGVMRGDQRLKVAFTRPMKEQDDPLLGPQQVPDDGFAFAPALFMPVPYSDAQLVSISYPPLEALRRGVKMTATLTREMVLGIAGLATGKLSSRVIGGPIMLYQLASQASEQGLAAFLKMFALISINLGLMNLLPVPVLDGFHILVSGIEGISRRAVPVRVREIASYVGIVMLLALMLLAFKNDVLRTFFQ